MMLFAMASELGFVVGDHLFFVVFQLQEGGDIVAGAGGGQGGVVNGAKEQPPDVYPLVFGHGLEKVEGPLGKLVAGSYDKYLFHILICFEVLDERIKVLPLGERMHDGRQG